MGLYEPNPSRSGGFCRSDLLTAGRTVGLWLFTAALLVPLRGKSGAAPQETPRHNVVLICIDTLRADHLGCYGYPQPTSPHLDDLAARGARFKRAYSTSPWTLPSVASLFSGLTPDTHRAHHFLAPISPQAQLLTQRLEEAGFQTQAFVGNYFLQPLFGLQRGFTGYNGDCLADRSEISSNCISDAAVEWVQQQAVPGFFLYLHYFDPHYNYIEHEGFEFDAPDTEFVRSGTDIWELRRNFDQLKAADFQRLNSLYDSEIAFTDYHIGRVLDALKERGLVDNTLVVVCSDHGEELGEKGWIGHTVPLYEETVRIPFLFCGPQIAPAELTDVVQLDDIAPTILDYLSLPPLALGTQGRSLLKLLGIDREQTFQRRRPPPVQRNRSDQEALLAVETQEIAAPREAQQAERRTRLKHGDWRIRIETDDEGKEVVRLFKVGMPEATGERSPEDHSEVVESLLKRIDDDYQKRRGKLEDAEYRRRAVVARRRALVDWPYKFILHEEDGREELFQLEQDPLERHNLVAEQPEQAQRLKLRLLELTQLNRRQALDVAPPLSVEDAQEHRGHLGALGYTR